MPVLYDGKALIPAPFVSITKEVLTTEDGKPIGSSFSVVITGKFVPDKGSPKSDMSFWTASGYPTDEVLTADQHLGSLLRKQEAVMTLFANDGKTFEITSIDGSVPPLKCNPRVKRISFPQGQWFNIEDYEIVLEADCIQGLVDHCTTPAKISRSSEEWNIETLDDHKQTYRLTHSVSATGRRYYDSTGTLVQEPWQNAKDYVLNTIGIGLKPDRMIAAGVLNATSLQAFNYLRTQAVGELNGTFSVTETWLCYDPGSQPPALEDWNVNIRTSMDGRTSVTVDGTIIGLQQRDNASYALLIGFWTNAYNKWTTVVRPNIFTRATSVSGVTLNPSVLNQTVGYNQVAGSVTYNYEFDDRPTSAVPNAVSDSVSISDHNPNDVFAQIPVLGRKLGPVLQAIGTITSRRRSVTIEIQMKQKTMSFTPTKPNTDALTLSYKPSGNVIVFVENDDESWTEKTGRYSRQTSFTWEQL